MLFFELNSVSDIMSKFDLFCLFYLRPTSVLFLSQILNCVQKVNFGLFQFESESETANFQHRISDLKCRSDDEKVVKNMFLLSSSAFCYFL